jgi:hypothetical protein
MLRDDPGGHFAAGYHDGAAREKFNPPNQPSDELRKTPLRKPTGSSATPLEKEWYRLCDSSSFIPTYVVVYYVAALDSQGSHVAVVIGLSDFTALKCPRCGGEGQFKIRFLGRLEHAECQWTGYMGTASYVGFQIVRVLHSGIRAGGSMKDDSDKKGARGGWVNAIFGFLFAGVFRAALAVVLIPLHTVVALCQPGQTMADVVTRVTTLCLMVAGFGVGIYEIQHPSRSQFRQAQASQPPGSTQEASSLPGQADWTAYVTNQHVSTTAPFSLSSDDGNTWQSFSLAPGATGVYKGMNRFRIVTSFPDGHTQAVNCPLPTHGVRYYSINCPSANCTWDISGDVEFNASRAKGQSPLPPTSSEVASSLPGQADWTAYVTNQHVSTTAAFSLSPDDGNTWQSFSLAPGATGVYKGMNRFRIVTSFPDGHTQAVNCPLPTHGVRYYSINCPNANCTWDISGDDEFAATRANR